MSHYLGPALAASTTVALYARDRRLTQGGAACTCVRTASWGEVDDPLSCPRGRRLATSSPPPTFFWAVARSRGDFDSSLAGTGRLAAGTHHGPFEIRSSWRRLSKGAELSDGSLAPS